MPTIMNNWPSTVVFAPRCGSTRVAKPRPMVREMACPAKISASKVSCTTMPMATPISTSWTAASSPAPERIDRAAGICTTGAIKNPSASDMTILTLPGMTVSLAIGAARTNPPTRSMGHHSLPTHRDTSAALRVSGCTRALADHGRNAGVKIMREIGEHTQNPGAGHEQGEDQQQELRNEAQRRFVDLSRRLQHPDGQTRDERNQQQRRRDHRGHHQHAVRQIHDVLGRHWWKLEARVPSSSVHPSTTTNNMILNGSDTRTGDSIIMPIDISTLATTRSMTRKGMNTMKPIWNAVFNSLVMKVGIKTLSGTSSALANCVFPESLVNSCKTFSRVCASMNFLSGCTVRP